MHSAKAKQQGRSLNPGNVPAGGGVNPDSKTEQTQSKITPSPKSMQKRGHQTPTQTDQTTQLPSQRGDNRAPVMVTTHNNPTS
jgi:hypothetical protein